MMASMIDTFDRFAQPFESQGVQHPMLLKHSQDGPAPAVLVLHELPGLTNDCLAFADAHDSVQFTFNILLGFAGIAVAVHLLRA
jgi:hypothetical protein